MDEKSSVDLFWPPDPVQPVREEAIHTAIAERELDGNRTNISMAQSSQISGETKGEDNSTSQELRNSKKSQVSTIPSMRNPLAAPATVAGESPHLRHEIRSPLEGNRAKFFTGDYSPVQGEHLLENLSNFDGGSDGGACSGESAGASAKKFEQDE
uniref:Uncharacterized protein n=1 Tax=Solanum tuberosum TaxID=4113 RepID=M1DHM2_SOLTU